MKLSTRARYGLKALIDLGLHSANEAISLQSIAERQDISTSYLEQLEKSGEQLIVLRFTMQNHADRIIHSAMRF